MKHMPTIEKIASKHESFGFGRIRSSGFTTHGFDQNGLHAFAFELLALAMGITTDQIDAIAEKYKTQSIGEVSDAFMITGDKMGDFVIELLEFFKNPGPE